MTCIRCEDIHISQYEGKCNQPCECNCHEDNRCICHEDSSCDCAVSTIVKCCGVDGCHTLNLNSDY
jgi:hypothetical protein